MRNEINEIEKMGVLMRYLVLTSTSNAGSGHPTSCLSAVELMTALFFGGNFTYDTRDPKSIYNDRLIFSKGHAAPLFYSLWVGAGVFPLPEMHTLRAFGSRVEGHPTLTFPYTDVATGSLGIGLSNGVGMAMVAKYLDGTDAQTYVLLGDGEMAEGSNWEAAQLAAYYKLGNLTAIIDVSRLEQTGPTMFGWDLRGYSDKFRSFGWDTIIVHDGHDILSVLHAYKKRRGMKKKPVAILARTVKGQGISFLANKEGWHGKALSKPELAQALAELGKVDLGFRKSLPKPEGKQHPHPTLFRKIATEEDQIKIPSFQKGEMVATRQAYGYAITRIEKKYPNLVVMDAGLDNSTFAEVFAHKYPERFFEMFIAEQNMVGVATGMSAMGKMPFVSTFASFLSRAHDQIRMSQYSNANIKFAGSHAGVSMGQDGASQMGLEDISLFRSMIDSVVLYPSDAVSTDKLVEAMARQTGIAYIRLTRAQTPVLYDSDEKFEIGGSKTLLSSTKDEVTIIACGITLHQALKAATLLTLEKVKVRVIDLYSIKPLDISTLEKAAKETKAILTVEDHYKEGGVGEAVASALSGSNIPIHSLFVNKMPRSGSPEALLKYEEIDAEAIVSKVKEILQLSS